MVSFYLFASSKSLTTFFLNLTISDLARNSEVLISNGLSEPSLLTFGIIFLAGLLTSLGPCSISLLPITVAYLAGFDNDQKPIIKSLSFCSGVLISLVSLGFISGFLGRVYGQVPQLLTELVALLAVIMGLNLLGIIPLNLPSGPDPNIWINKVPKTLAPVSAGMAFGLAASPCTTPVLAVLLGWIAQNGDPVLGIFFLACFGSGQLLPLMIAGTAAASIPKFLSIKPIGKWIPAFSGVLLLSVGLLTLMANFF